MPTTDLQRFTPLWHNGHSKGVDLIIGGRTGEAPCPRRWREKREEGGGGVYIVLRQRAGLAGGRGGREDSMSGLGESRELEDSADTES